MRTDRTISTVRRDTVCFAVSVAVHVVVLSWGVFTFTGRPHTPDSQEPMPIDVISATEFSQLTAGTKTAPKAETAKPLAEQVGERKVADDPVAKLAKKEIKAATDVPPVPEARPPTPAEKKQSEPKKAEPDPIADAIKKDLAKKSEPKKSEPKKAEPKTETKSDAKVQTPPKKEAPKFDPRKVEALLDKRTPQRLAASGDVLNSTVALGTPTGSAAQLSQSEIDAFRQKLKTCWSPPAGAPNAQRIIVPITIRLKLDRTLAAAPVPEMRAKDPYTQAMIESAVRAIIQCQPYTMFSVPKYETWKELPIDFDPTEMFGG